MPPRHGLADVDQDRVAVPGAGEAGLLADLPAVEDDHHVGLVTVGDRPRLVPGTVGEVRAEHGDQLGELGPQHPGRPGRVCLGQMLGMRQPLDPLPVRGGLLPAAHRDADILGGVESEQLGQQRASHAVGQPAVAAQQDLREAAHEHRDRLVGHCHVGVDEPAQRPGAQRFQVLDGLGLDGVDLDCEELRPGTDPDLGEVVVRRPPFPEPVAQRDRPQ